MFHFAGSIISWKASLQSTVALSTTEAEYWYRQKQIRKAFGYKS